MRDAALIFISVMVSISTLCLLALVRKIFGNDIPNISNTINDNKYIPSWVKHKNMEPVIVDEEGFVSEISSQITVVESNKTR